MNKSKHTQLIREEANRLGFQFVGFSKAEFLEKEAPRLEKWLVEDHHGQMSYMENYFDKRLDPRLLVDDAKSVVSLLLNYYPHKEQEDPSAPKLSKYAYGQDYHHVIKSKMKDLVIYIQDNIGEINGRAFVDSAPVMDKVWAAKGGLGWIGKNANLITKNHGSFSFIAELIIDLPLDYDHGVKDFCGKCTKCIDECPTDAIVEPYVVDGSKCISYFTIELKEALPVEMKGKFDDWMFGCDVCQDVCPWNRFATPHNEPLFNPHPDLLTLTKDDWQDITKDVFNELFRKSAVKRTKHDGLRRNIEFLKD